MPKAAIPVNLDSAALPGLISNIYLPRDRHTKRESEVLRNHYGGAYFHFLLADADLAAAAAAHGQDLEQEASAVPQFHGIPGYDTGEDAVQQQYGTCTPGTPGC